MFAGPALVACLAASGMLAQPSEPSRLALVGGTVHLGPTEPPLRDGVVLVQDGRIAALGRASEVRLGRDVPTLDCRGLHVVPGFWNSHVHFFERKWANAGSLSPSELAAQLEDMFTRYGFTTVFDLGSDPENT